MTALAKEMGARRQYFPVTDNTRDHIAIAGHSAKQLAQVLLEDEGLNLHQRKPTQPELEYYMANMAIESVLPMDIASVPIRKIIEVRQRYGDEIGRFQSHFHSVVTDAVWLADVEDEWALQTHLHRLYEDNLKRELDDFRHNLRSWGIETVRSSLNVQIAVPALLTGGLFGGLSLNPVMAGIGAVSFTAFSVLLDAQKKRREVLKSSPAAYLFHIQENLTPSTLSLNISARAKALTYGS